MGASPGVIDGQFGSNVDKALVAYRAITGRNLQSSDTEAVKKALAEFGGDAFTTYTITSEDAAGPFVASVPADYGHKAKLERLSFTSVSEMLAERFHMDEAYLKSLNADAVFGRPGTVIRVVNTGGNIKAQVSRIIADKASKQVRAYDASGKLVAAYPQPSARRTRRRRRAHTRWTASSSIRNTPTTPRSTSSRATTTRC